MNTDQSPSSIPSLNRRESDTLGSKAGGKSVGFSVLDSLWLLAVLSVTITGSVVLSCLWDVAAAGSDVEMGTRTHFA